jgi:hypothetical protein
MIDPTEPIRRARLIELGELTREAQSELDFVRKLEAQYGKVWDSQGLRQDFEVLGFMAPLVVVRERATGKKGSLEFTHNPRAYFNWVED